MNPSLENIFTTLLKDNTLTGTKDEKLIEESLLKYFKSNDYFLNNPNMYGLYSKEDILDRKVIWALKKGSFSKTIILLAHYDIVTTSNYNDLEPYSFEPEILKEKLKELELSQEVYCDIESNEWIFGRGSCDMKGGLAINLYTLLNHNTDDINILFIAVHDEENLSSGMREATELLMKLKKDYELDYELLILTEPHNRSSNNTFTVYTGSVGKVMPLILTKGKMAHCSRVMDGINSASLLSEIVKNLEFNTMFSIPFQGMVCPPPTVLGIKDLKSSYDVSMPEFSAAYFNINFFKNIEVSDILYTLKTLCITSFEDVLKRFNYCYDYMLTHEGEVKEKSEVTYSPVVYTFEELESKASSMIDNYDTVKNNIVKNIFSRVLNNEITIQDGGMLIVKSIVDLCNFSYPVVIVGIIPPYYPAVNNHYLNYDDSKLLSLVTSFLKYHDLNLENKPFFMGISDLSYTSCTNLASELKVIHNLITCNDHYNIPLMNIAELNIPIINIGPWGKDLHLSTERVFKEDLFNLVPRLIQHIIKNI